MKLHSLKELTQRYKGYLFPLLVLCVGVILMLLPGDGEEQNIPVKTAGFSLTEFTRETEEILSQIDGVGKVKLILTLETDGKSTYLRDSRENRDNTSEDIDLETVVVKVDGNEEPVTMERAYPVFRGAVVVCRGGGSPSVTLTIKMALSSLTGLGMDKITVLEMN